MKDALGAGLARFNGHDDSSPVKKYTRGAARIPTLTESNLDCRKVKADSRWKAHFHFRPSRFGTV